DEVATAFPIEVIDVPVEKIEADLFVIGPEAPLVEGLADRLRSRGALVFGPGADGARLEGSKAWMKEVLKAAKIPTARFAAFREKGPAIEYLKSFPGPYVVKTDGLAAGKGVLVTESLDEATRDVIDKLAGRSFGQAGSTVVIEQFMQGPELSLMALCDGKRAVPLAPAQDFKRIFDADQGPNTGGMGAYSPVTIAGRVMVEQVMDTCISPLVLELVKRGIDYRGVLYAGLIITRSGPKVVEFNIRFGDPEAQVVLSRITSNLALHLAEAARGDLQSPITWSDEACVTVVVSSEGYPQSPRTGDLIEGLGTAEQVKGVKVYHAGTGLDDSGRLVTAGGRVLNVTATGPNLAEARRRAYKAVSKITWPGMHYRRDIASQAAGVPPEAPNTAPEAPNTAPEAPNTAPTAEGIVP
ncbi:MAG TPA: phosphoribosylamine--glycine ligase, partial [Acidimicrobiales bacterium]|nr:phosphoribosylamine--glycine ligase [Acidimicrobiales bacterium]